MPAYLKKAPLGGAFFVLLVCLFLLYALRACLAADCNDRQAGETFAVAFVIDGDSLRLKNGEEVRLIGLDTPEFGRKGRADKPFAREARKALVSLVEVADGRVLVRPGIDRRDRYGRLLAHIYAPDGENLTAELLRQGLGYQAIVAPNQVHLACYRAAEREARNAGRGLWRQGVADAEELSADDAGFHLVQGRVARVGQSRSTVWLELAGGASVQLPWKVWRDMTSQEPEAFVDRRLEVRGWFYPYKDALRVRISHPASIHWL
jgi:endonuclease YncB( thermonuclease family)